MPTKTFLNPPDCERRRLEEAARAEFGRAPYGKVSINRILHTACIPQGSFYMYFTDKGDLFTHLPAQSGEEMPDRPENQLRLLRVGLAHRAGKPRSPAAML